MFDSLALCALYLPAGGSQLVYVGPSQGVGH